MTQRDLFERTRRFAIDVFTFCRRLPATDETRDASRQLRRAANSVRANYRAARRGRSRAEFESKLGTVFEEADEAADWLRYFRDTGLRHDAALIDEAEALAKIFAASVKTARRNTSRSKALPKS